MARSQSDLLSRFLDPVADRLNPTAARALASLQIDPVVQRRIDKLAAKANEGRLSMDERSEYETYVVANDLVSILQLRARRRTKPTRR